MRRCTPVWSTLAVLFLAAAGSSQNQMTREQLAARNKQLNDAFNSGMEAVQNRRYDEAVTFFGRAAEIDPGQSTVWAQLASARVALSKNKTGLERDAELNRALEAYQKARDLKPNDAGIHNNYAIALALAGRIPEAETELAGAVQNDPANARLYYFNLGAVLTNGGQNAPACRAFKKAIEIDSSYAEAHYQYGICLMGMAQVAADGSVIPAAGTREAFLKYLELTPRGPNAQQARDMLAAVATPNRTVSPTSPAAAPSRGVTQPDAVAQNHRATRYFALVIGNNDYRYTTPLRTAVNDAQQVDSVLRTRYGFETELMLNATRDQILGALNRYRRDLPADSAFLIYYAGHGYFDREAGRAYWLPVDAQPNENTRWISADDITSDIRTNAARQILVISDSCYSGALSRSVPVTNALPSGDRERFLQLLRTRGPSRILLSSGGNEPVTDAGGTGAHSVFASALLRGLSEMPVSPYTVEELFSTYIRESVAGRSGQIPECSPLRNSGHDSGSFIFERRR